jgi:dynein intermediate chain 1, axonemal
VNKQFQQNTNVAQYIVHFSVDGETIQKDCPDDIIQEEILNSRKKMMKETIDLHGLEPPTTDEERQEYRKIMRNKFNYSQRETQTPPVIIRDAKVSTAKPNLKNFKGTINQSTIWDLYVKAKMEMLSKEQKEPQKNQATAKDNSKEGQASLYSPNFKRCLKVMERMIMQNEQQSCYRNYKYMFTDQDGDFSKKNPSSVSLWNFDFDSTKKKNVTSICWNPKYSDMFAVGYGLYDFGKKKSVGYITICSLKNSKTSEMTFQTDGDVMSLDFHPYIPALLAVGLYDGVVLVYDIRNKTKQPIYQSSIKSKKHTDPVWQVKWNKEKSEYNNFYSISSDGRVMNWILMKDKLEPEEVIRLKLVSNPLRNKNNSRFRSYR